MTKEIIGVLIAIIVLGGGYYIYNQSPREAEDIDTTAKEQVEAHNEDEQVMEKVPLPTEGTFTIDSSLSKLEYSANRIVGPVHRGSAVVTSGEVEFKESAVIGTFSIDMTSITEENDNERFLRGIKSDNFFDVENNPTAIFSISSVSPNDEGSFKVTGDLTVLGKANEIMFDAEMSINGDTASVSADIIIDRTRWGIVYDSDNVFFDLGDKAIIDEIPITLDLTFTKTN